MTEWTMIDGDVTAARGFSAAGVEARIRYRDRPDLAIVRCSERATAAAVFTSNRFASPSVQVDREQLAASGGYAQAIVVNAGNANAGTGARGLQDAREITARVAEKIGADPRGVLVASTGVIGEFLPMDAVRSGIDKAAAALEAGGNDDFPRAIMTTDTVPKRFALEFDLHGETVRIGGACKGAGMIAPNMATMLAFLSTDANAAPAFLQQALRRAVAKTFNRISVDGDSSTNDTVFLMGSGLSASVESHTEAAARFEEALETVCRELARRIARDGEGATTLIEVEVRGGVDEPDAERAARAIAESNLVKTAVYGKDANWGRIICALGYSGATFQPDDVELWMGETLLVKGGVRVDYDEEEATARLSEDPVRIVADLHAGNGAATFWTCDLTEGYIEENAAYRS